MLSSRLVDISMSSEIRDIAGRKGLRVWSGCLLRVVPRKRTGSLPWQKADGAKTSLRHGCLRITPSSMHHTFLHLTTSNRGSRRAIDIMPKFQANDDVSLHYETHGSVHAPPLILVSAHEAPPLSATKSPHSYMASPALAQSSNAT